MNHDESKKKLITRSEKWLLFVFKITSKCIQGNGGNLEGNMIKRKDPISTLSSNRKQSFIILTVKSY